MSLKVLIVDDEPLARERMQHLINGLEGYRALESQACNGVEALELTRKLQPDIILLDIRMPGMDGLQMAKQLTELSLPPALIFCTAFSEHALDAFSVYASGYLLKPVRRDALKEALDQAAKTNRLQRQTLANQNDDQPERYHITARTHKGVELIPLTDIFYFLAESKYVTVRHKNGETLIDNTLKELEQQFGDRFVRIHRNALVDRHRIMSMNRQANGQYGIHLQGLDEPLTISRRHVAKLRKLLQSL